MLSYEQINFIKSHMHNAIDTQNITVRTYLLFVSCFFEFIEELQLSFAAKFKCCSFICKTKRSCLFFFIVLKISK